MSDLVDRLRAYDDGPSGRGWRLCLEAADEIDRLRIMLKAISTQNYDAGYTPEMLAEYALDPKFDAGDLGANLAMLAAT